LPRGWKDRLIIVQNENTRGAKGLCLEVHDLLASKAIVGREKDIAFLRDAAEYGLADRDELIKRLNLLDLEISQIERARAAVRRIFSSIP
jgi:hypothetical protein